jgi:hypothetical protein
MPVSYYDQLRLQLTEAATAKKAALDAAYDRATTATFDASGNATYKKDASGNNIYGTRDVQYMEQKRNTATGAESSGTLRSGQNLRNVVNDEAAYRADIATAAGNLTAQKDTIDTETATKAAEYKAMYGDGKGSTGSVPAPGPAPGPGTGTAAPRATTGPGGAIISPAGGKAMADAYKRFRPSYGAPAKAGAKPTAVTPKPKTVVPKRIGGY